MSEIKSDEKKHEYVSFDNVMTRMIKMMCDSKESYQMYGLVYHNGTEKAFQKIEVICIPGCVTLLVTTIPTEGDPYYEMFDSKHENAPLKLQAVMEHINEADSRDKHERKRQRIYLLPNKKWVMSVKSQLDTLVAEASAIPYKHGRVVHPSEYS